MIDLKSIRVEDMAPENLLQDKNISDLAHVISNKLNEFSIRARELNYAENYRQLPEELIDHLLWEDHLFKEEEGLLLVDSLSEKVDLLESAVELHKTKGTPHAVERIFELLNLKAKVEEWFQYGGDPYHFKIEINVTEKGLDEKRLSSLDKLVNEYKNVRSYLEKIIIIMNGEIKERLSSNTSMGERMTILPPVKTKIDSALNQRRAALFREGERVLVRPHLVTSMKLDTKTKFLNSSQTGEEVAILPYELKSISERITFVFGTSFVCAESLTTYPKTTEFNSPLINMPYGNGLYSAETLSTYPSDL